MSLSILASQANAAPSYKGASKPKKFVLSFKDFNSLSSKKQKKYLVYIYRFLAKEEKSFPTFVALNKSLWFDNLFLSLASAHGSHGPHTPAKVADEPEESPVVATTKGQLCDPSTSKCCIHSGNVIPLTEGRCLGGDYIACTTNGGQGFKCNKLMFGLNSDGNEFCVPKGSPHNYSEQCADLSQVKAADEQHQKFLATNKSEWDALVSTIDSYCKSPDRQSHNVSNCETLAKRSEEMIPKDGSADGAPKSPDEKFTKEIAKKKTSEFVSDKSFLEDNFSDLKTLEAKIAEGESLKFQFELDLSEGENDEVANNADGLLPYLESLMKKRDAIKSASEKKASASGPKEGDTQIVNDGHGGELTQTYRSGEWTPPAHKH